MNKHLKFEDLQDFWDYSFRESRSYKKTSRDHTSGWNGCVSWEEAKRLATFGWFDGLEKMKTISVELSEIVATKIERHHPEYAFAGHIVDVGMFLSNSPEYFIVKDPIIREQDDKILTLVCSVSFSAQISSDVIIQRGAMICALVDALEMSGYRCEIIINDVSISRGRLEIDVMLKKAQQSLNLAELAFCLGHPAMLRRFMFSTAELVGWADYSFGYGNPAEATEKGDLYIHEIFSRVVPNSEAIDWVIKQLNHQGINMINNNLLKF